MNLGLTKLTAYSVVYSSLLNFWGNFWQKKLVRLQVRFKSSIFTIKEPSIPIFKLKRSVGQRLNLFCQSYAAFFLITNWDIIYSLLIKKAFTYRIRRFNSVKFQLPTYNGPSDTDHHKVKDHTVLAPPK